MDVRSELPEDGESVREVHLQAFGDHGDQVAQLVNSLRAFVQDGRGISLVADVAGSVVGHIMFTCCLLDAPRELVEVQVLSPLAVVPQRQRRGIGSLLVSRGLKTLAEKGAPVVFLEGDPGYYGRFGFLPGGDHGFRKPSLRIPDAAFQMLRLPAYEAWMTGTLVYSDPFWHHDLVGLRDEGR